MAPDVEILTEIIRKNLNKATLRDVAFERSTRKETEIEENSSRRNAFEDRTQS